MNKTVKILSALLVVQLGMAGGIYFQSRHSGSSAGTESLLRLEPADFDQVTISEPEKPSMTLKKKEGQWVLPERWDFPVSKEKVSLTIDKLLDLKKSWPVGDSASARKRFKVAEDSFEKKVVFFQKGKEKKTLFLGTSPEYRKVHLRPSDRDDVVLAEFGYHDLSINPTDWEDKRFLSVDRNSLFQIETPSVQLVNKENGFQVNSLKPGEEGKPSEVESLVSQITNLTYLELMGTTASPDFGLDTPDFKVTLRTKDGQTDVWEFSKGKTGDDYFLKTSRHPTIFKIAKSTVDALKSATHSKLVKLKSS